MAAHLRAVAKTLSQLRVSRKMPMAVDTTSARTALTSMIQWGWVSRTISSLRCRFALS